MKKLLAILLLAIAIAFSILIFVPTVKPAHAAGTAKVEPMITLPVRVVKDMRAELKHYQDIVKASAEVNIKDLKVSEDVDGKIYVKDTVSVDVKIMDLTYSGVAKTNANVVVFPKKETKPFISRFGVVNAVEQDEAKIDSKLNKNNVYLDYKAIAIKRLGVDLLAGRFRYGIGLSYVFTPNTFIVAGANCKYSENPKSNCKAFVGAGFRF